jgi:hypothetical protein
MLATAASRRLTTARCLLASEACRTSRAAHRSSIAVRLATTCCSSSLMSSGIRLGFARGAGQGLDERLAGREVPAWRDDPPRDDGPAPYRGDPGQLLVVGLVQHPLLGLAQLLIEAEADEHSSVPIDL